MYRVHRLLGLVLPLLVVGCTDSVAGPESTSPVFARGASGPSINGHVHSVIFGGLETNSFHARLEQDGTVRGTVQVRSRGQEISFHGEVTCLEVIGNEAKFGGFATRSETPSDAEVTTFVARIEDNGEGSGAVDRWTFFYIGTTDSSFPPRPDPCTFDLSSVPMFPVEDGNIQVRP